MQRRGTIAQSQILSVYDNLLLNKTQLNLSFPVCEVWLPTAIVLMSHNSQGSSDNVLSLTHFHLKL